MKNFLPLQEILEIYCISRKLVRDILRNYGIDCYKKEDDIYINFKEFHQIYTTRYNPVLFKIEEKEPVIKNTINRTFFNIFSEPVDYKQKLKKFAMTYAG